MKRKYESPIIRIVVIAPQSRLLTVNSVQDNVDLKLGEGSGKDARAHSARFSKWNEEEE